MISAIETVTIGVGSLVESLDLFVHRMGFRVEADFPASASLCNAWRLDEGVGARVVELSCGGYTFGRLRLVAYQPEPLLRVRSHSGAGPHDSATDIGPKAIDFYVRPPISKAFAIVTGGGFQPRSEPILHEVGNMISEEFVCWGPDGVPLLFMVGHRHNAEQMRLGLENVDFSEVATVSVVGEDIGRTRNFYVDCLQLNTVTDASTAPEFLNLANDLTGVPRGTPIHWLLYGGHGEPSGKTLVVHFGGAAAKRLTDRMRPGRLGFSLMTHRCENLDDLQDRVMAHGFDVFSGPVAIDLGGASVRTMLVRGPNEEMLEFVERGPVVSRNKPLEGKVCIATGASRGLGRDTARLLSKAGASVVIASRNAEACEALAAELRAGGRPALAFETDVTSFEAMENLVAYTEQELGAVHLAFNNAGKILGSGALQSASPSDFEAAFDLNARGTFNALRTQIPAIARAGGGAMVLTSAGSGLRGRASIGLYSAAKAASIMLAQVAALEAGPQGVRVNVVAPGYIGTAAWMSILGDQAEQLAGSVPLRQIGRGDDVASTVVWLLSDAANYVTGAVLPVDGGLLLT